MLRVFLAVLSLASLAACSKSEFQSVAPGSPVPKHEHHPPHGGTPVVLGHEAYHLEIVRDAAGGRLDLYVLDGEMENFVRVGAPALEIVAEVGGTKRSLLCRAVPNSATGETIGSTSQFEGQADWLKTTDSFDAVLTRLEVRGTIFTAVAFNFPKGNDTD